MKLGLSGRLTRATIGSPLTPLFLLASLIVGLIAVVVIPREEEPQISVPMVDIRVNADGLRGPDAVELVTAFWSAPGPMMRSFAFTKKSGPIWTASRSALPSR